MAWIDEALPLFRIIIGDDDSPYTYCDTRLSDLLIGVAKLVVNDISFENDYVVTVSTGTITPDPSDDPYFIPLVCLRAAYQVASSEYKQGVMSSVMVVDGPSTINLSSRATGLKARMDQLLADYHEAKLQYSLGNAIGCQAVTTPTTYSESIYNFYQYRAPGQSNNIFY